MSKLFASLLVCTTLLVSHRAQAQDLFTDVFREAVDESRLRQDYRALQRDLATGNSVGAQYDLMRIQQDRVNLARDQMQIDYDLGRYGGGYPNANGYYYSNVGNIAPPTYVTPLQSLPQQIQPLPQQQIVPPLNPVPAGALPMNPIPAVQFIRISNPETTGVTLSFVFGGKTYSVDSGRIEEFSVTGPTLIVFNRGGQAGVARYTLTGGNTFEFKYDTTGWFMVQKQVAPTIKPFDSVPLNPVPNSLPAPTGTGVPPAPSSQQP